MRTNYVLLRIPLLCLLLEFGGANNPPGHLEPIGNSGPVHPVDHVDGFLPPKVFLEQYLKKNKPLVMKGAAKVSPAFSLWSDDYLRSKTPLGKLGEVFVEHGKKENRSEPSGDMNFAEFLDKYNTSDIYMVNHVPNFLKEDIIMPFSIQCDAFNKNFADAVMWFSSGGTKSVLHNDNYENINCLYRGRKRLVFINVTKYESFAEKIMDNRKHGHSNVDVERVDLGKYPFFAGMHFHIAEMEPGDCLYIPLLWYHHVESFDSNLAVNVWFFPKKKLDLSTCRDEFDKSLVLSKFDYSMKDEGDGGNESKEEEEVETSEKEPALKERDITSDSPDLAEVIYNNLVSFLVPKEGGKVSKKEFMSLMTMDKKIASNGRKILHGVFLILDSNKNGMVDDVDFNAKLHPKKGAILVKLMHKWNTIAEKMELTTPNFLLAENGQEQLPPVEGSSDKLAKPQVLKETIMSVGDKDEL